MSGKDKVKTNLEFSSISDEIRKSRDKRMTVRQFLEGRAQSLQRNFKHLVGKLSDPDYRAKKLARFGLGYVAPPPPPEAPARELTDEEVGALKAAYAASPLASEPDSFALYRVIGNDLPPRHQSGQSRRNVQFILENEPELPNCQKGWIVNRIINPEEEQAIIELLERHDQTYVRLPFDLDDYATRGWALEDFPSSLYLYSEEVEEMIVRERLQALVQVHRHKNNYVMNNNGARNAALDAGRAQGAKWICPFDGNIFVPRHAWDQLLDVVRDEPHWRHFIIPMARITDNAMVLDPDLEVEAKEEPQVMFRRDATQRFDEAHPYGRRPKVELLWRLGVPGPWQKWRHAPWDLAVPELCDDAGDYRHAGWVARLFSGAAHLEQQEFHAFQERGVERAQGILSFLEGLDVQILERSFDPERLVTYDPEILEKAARDDLADAPAARKAKAQVLRHADEALGRGPYSVIDKTTLPPSGDKRDYWHVAPYWWPDPESETGDGLPYIRRDGERIPGTQLYEEGSEKYDRTSLQRVFDDATALALAWKLTGEAKYAEHAAEIVRRWFLKSRTAMRPHLRYAQVIMGHNNGEGFGHGCIEMKDLYFLLDAVRLLRGSGAFSERDDKALRDWLTEYLNWLLQSPQGKSEMRTVNNHGPCYDLQVGAIAAYLGERTILLDVFRRAEDRIRGHFEADGTQPHESKRTMTRHYYAFNLQSWANLARLAEGCGVDLWDRMLGDHARLRTAMDWFLAPERQADWPLPQSTAFDEDRIAPLAAAAARRYPDASAHAWSARIDAAAPVLDPHDGAPIYWAFAR